MISNVNTNMIDNNNNNEPISMSQSFNVAQTHTQPLQYQISQISKRRQFQCVLTDYCISETLRCNGIKNCGFGDDSDEEACFREVKFNLIELLGGISGFVLFICFSIGIIVIIIIVLSNWYRSNGSRQQQHFNSGSGNGNCISNNIDVEIKQQPQSSPTLLINNGYNASKRCIGPEHLEMYRLIHQPQHHSSSVIISRNVSPNHHPHHRMITTLTSLDHASHNSHHHTYDHHGSPFRTAMESYDHMTNHHSTTTPTHNHYHNNQMVGIAGSSLSSSIGDGGQYKMAKRPTFPSSEGLEPNQMTLDETESTFPYKNSSSYTNLQHLQDSGDVQIDSPDSIPPPPPPPSISAASAISFYTIGRTTASVNKGLVSRAYNDPSISIGQHDQQQLSSVITTTCRTVTVAPSDVTFQNFSASSGITSTANIRTSTLNSHVKTHSTFGYRPLITSGTSAQHSNHSLTGSSSSLLFHTLPHNPLHQHHTKHQHEQSDPTTITVRSNSVLSEPIPSHNQSVATQVSLNGSQSNGKASSLSTTATEEEHLHQMMAIDENIDHYNYYHSYNNNGNENNNEEMILENKNEQNDNDNDEEQEKQQFGDNVHGLIEGCVAIKKLTKIESQPKRTSSSYVHHHPTILHIDPQLHSDHQYNQFQQQQQQKFDSLLVDK